MIKRNFLIHGFGLVFFVCISMVLAQPMSTFQADQMYREVVARGMGAIIANDVAKAEDDAIANALRNAVEQVIGTMVESEVLVRNYQTIEDKIYSYTKGFVERYDVLSRSQRGQTIYEVTIKAVVKKGNLKDNLQALGLLIARKGKPRLGRPVSRYLADRR